MLVAVLGDGIGIYRRYKKSELRKKDHEYKITLCISERPRQARIW